MTASLSREFLLMAACAVWPPSNRRAEAIRDAAAGPLDWDRFLQVVSRHHLAGLVHDGLTRTLPAAPADIASEIAVEARALVRANLAYAAEATRLWRLFTEAHLPVVFIKGVSLAMLAYGNLGLRHSRDVDLLVPAEATSKASAILERAGYRRLQPPPSFSEAQLRMWMHRCKEILYVHDDKRLELELHSRPFDNPRLMSELLVNGSVRIVSVAKGVCLPTFGDEDLFAYLCAHGADHSWFRLKWLADVGALLAQQPEGGVERLYGAAEARGVGPSAAQAMLLCRRLLGTMIPDPLAAKLLRKPRRAMARNDRHASHDRRSHTDRPPARNDAEQPRSLPLGPGLALLAGGNQSLCDQPCRHIDAAASRAPTTSLSGFAAATLDVASPHLSWPPPN